MIYPNHFSNGVADLLNNSSAKDIIFVEIYSLGRGKGLDYPTTELLEDSFGITISPKVLSYIPPRLSEDRKVGSSLYMRNEKVPRISDPTQAYLIIDDVFQTGKTLSCLVRALESQSIPKKNMWFFLSIIIPPSSNHSPPFLDRADVFLKYVLENRVEVKS